MKSFNGIPDGESGFTLIELMIAILISAVLAGSIFTIYRSQEKAAEQVESMSAMQQNLRSALFLMEREIRMAGLDTTLSGFDAVITANAGSFRFASDLRGTTAGSAPDGAIDNTFTIEPNEDITYALNASNQLVRNGGVIAENVLALDFVYLDAAGVVLNPVVANARTNVASDQFSNIQTVQLSILVQAPRRERNYVNNQSYQNLQGFQLLAAQNDQFRRLLAVTSVRIRNM